WCLPSAPAILALLAVSRLAGLHNVFASQSTTLCRILTASCQAARGGRETQTRTSNRVQRAGAGSFLRTVVQRILAIIARASRGGCGGARDSDRCHGVAANSAGINEAVDRLCAAGRTAARCLGSMGSESS